MTPNIPYVISEAHPDYKRPYLFEDFGVVDEKMMDTFFVEKVTEFICDRIDRDDIKSVDDIGKFWYNYFDEYYMDNSPWNARIFINGEWKNITPTDIQIFECFQRLKMEEKEDQDQEQENFQNEDEEGVAFELTEEEKDIQERMRKFLENELDKSDFEAMSKMNKNEQIIFIFTQCLLYIPSEKYKTNRELLQNFFNIIFKYTQQEISILTEKMTEDHNDKTSEYLTHLMNVYGSLLEYKTIFDNFNSFKG